MPAPVPACGPRTSPPPPAAPPPIPDPHPASPTGPYPGPYPAPYPDTAGLRRVLGATLALTAGAAFVFSFRNIWLLALAAGTNPLIAPLIAPTLDLSVIGLLTVIRAGTLRGIPHQALRPATGLLHACGTLSLALNTAPAAAAHAYTRAALDALAPGLLIAWAAVAPGLYDALAHPAPPGTGTAMAGTAPGPHPPETEPADTPPVPATGPGAGSAPTAPGRHPRTGAPASRRPGRARAAPSAALLARATALDTQTRTATGAPASIRQLRTLGIGQHRAQQLKASPTPGRRGLDPPGARAHAGRTIGRRHRRSPPARTARVVA